ncbi:uncharacterized protein LOC119322469 [Triticum dicoccoides]|uniref:uncharacterized protein LOC119322469 n=1 Tax=Triticum dicoccoides TaxID=85692 RepID=UPI001890C645|nr:uncharacterized protein LOC119322469 [Triticum dicoccoides]
MAGDLGSSAATGTARPTRPAMAMAGRSSTMAHVHHHANGVPGCKAKDGAGALGRPPTRSYSHSQRHSQQPSRRSHHRRSHSHSEGEPTKHRQPGCKQLTGETMGGLATASCLLPCAVVDFAFLATVRAPVALCRRAVRGSRLRRSASVGEAEMAKLREEADSVLKFGRTASAWPATAPAEEEKELEKQVWASFRDAGFGRTSKHLDNDVS